MVGQRWYRLQVVLVAMLVVLALIRGGTLWGFVNPNFTPHHVDEQSEFICTVRVKSVAGDGRSAELTVDDFIKGKTEPKVLKVNFAKVLAEEDGPDIVKEIISIFRASGKRPAMFAYGGTENGFAIMHISETWIRLDKGAGKNEWLLRGPDSSLNGTFNGGTDMLIATLRFIRKFPGLPVMPVAGGVSWSEHTEIGKLPGKAAGIDAVDVNTDNRLDIVVYCPAGNRIYLNTKKGFRALDVGGTASLAGAWADFDGNGRPDLASLTATGLRILFQDLTGKFTSREIKAVAGIGTTSPSVHVIDLGLDGVPDLVLGTGMPLLLKNKGKGDFEPAKLPDAKTDLEAVVSGPCVVLDIDNDGICDILQTFRNKGLIYRGKADGSFDVKVDPNAGMGKVAFREADIGDINGDGLLDIFLIGGGRTPFLLENRGDRFEEVMRYSGEPSYIIQAGAGSLAIGDFNNDTFLDIFAGYPEEPCQFFFNRGFRSLAIDEPLKFREEDVPGAADGHAAAVWADLDMDGSEDLVTALSDKSLCHSISDLGEMDEPLCIQARLDRKGKYTGPVNVRFYVEGFCLGARVATRWGKPATLGVPEPGEYVIKYTLPGRKEITRKLEVETGITGTMLDK